jgi:hypothetical protein
LACGCPGAGGYDAVYALAIAPRATSSARTDDATSADKAIVADKAAAAAVVVEEEADAPAVALRSLWSGWQADETTPHLGKVTPLALTVDDNMGLRCEWLA